MCKIELPKLWLKRNITGIIALCMFMPMMPHGCSTMDAHKKHEETSRLIGNKICPVSGQNIDEKTKVKYSYKGKTYNFCCATCVDEFKKDPEKYLEKVDEELKKESEAKSDEEMIIPEPKMSGGMQGDHKGH